MKTDGFLKYKHRFFGKTVISYMPPERVKEIDEPVDLQIAESMLRRQKEVKVSFPKKIDAVLFDFDGVMTDDTVITDENGKESVRCSREDGMGISLLKRKGIKVAVLSTEKNPVVLVRCKKLNIECFYKLGNNKIDSMKNYLEDNKISPDNVIFMGNDVNDVECLEFAGFAVVPQNAKEEAKKVADLIINKNGGQGAVRELCNLIIKNNP